MGWMESIKDKKEKEQAQAVLKMIPDKLKDKTADEITALLNEAPDLKTKVAELEAQRATDTETVTKIQTEFEAVKTRLANADAARNNNNNNNNNRQEPPPDFIDDPDAAFNQRVAPVAQIAVNNAAMTARILAQQQ